MDNEDCMITNAIIKPRLKQEPRRQAGRNVQPGYGQQTVMGHGGQPLAPSQPAPYTHTNNTLAQGHRLPQAQQRAMPSNNPTWEGIQATFTRQQYLTHSQPQVQQQQQQQQQQHQQQQWSNQYGQQTFQGQQFLAQNTFTALPNQMVPQQSQHTTRQNFSSNNYSSQHSGVFRGQRMPNSSQARTLSSTMWPQQSQQQQRPQNFGTQVPQVQTRNYSGWTPNMATGTSSIGASPTPPQTQQMPLNRMQAHNNHSPQGASIMPYQAPTGEHRHFICEFAYDGRVVSLERCLNDRCNLVQINDGGYSQVTNNWLFVGPIDVKAVVQKYADKLIIEQRDQREKFLTKMAWLTCQPNSNCGVRINDLAPPNIRVTAKINDMNRQTSVSPAAAASPSISPGVAQQHQQLSQANQAHLMAQMQQVVQGQRAMVAAQPQLAQDNFATLQEELNRQQRMASRPVRAQTTTQHQQQQFSNAPPATVNGLPPVPPLQPRPDIATVSNLNRQMQDQTTSVTSSSALQGNTATATSNNLPQTNSTPESSSAETSGTRLQTVDDWDRYLATTGQSMLVIAPEPGTPETPQDINTSNPSDTGDSSQGIPIYNVTNPALQDSAKDNSTASSVDCSTTTSGIGTVIGTISIELDVPNKRTGDKVNVSQNNSQLTTGGNQTYTSSSATDTVASSDTVTAERSQIDNRTVSSQETAVGMSSQSACRTGMDANPSAPQISTNTEPQEERLPLNLPPGVSSVPEFINLDLMSDICLTPEKEVSTNPLDTEFSEQKTKDDRKKEKNLNAKDKVAVGNTKQRLISEDSGTDSSADETYRPFNSRRKRKRNPEDDDEDYVPDYSSPDERRTSSRRKRLRLRSTESSDVDTESSMSSYDTSFDSDSEIELRRRRSKRKRRRRRVYISEDDSSDDRQNTNPPNLEVQIHRLTKSDIKKVKRHLKKRKFVSVKFSLHCPKCKLVKKANKRYHTELPSVDTCEPESHHHAEESHGTMADDDTTVIAFCSSSIGKEPVHQPVSDSAPSPVAQSQSPPTEDTSAPELTPCSDTHRQEHQKEETSKVEELKASEIIGVGEEVSNSAISEQTQESIENLLNIISAQETKSVEADSMHDVKNSHVTMNMNSQPCSSSQNNASCDWEEWKKLEDITSYDDLVLVMKEFESRKGVFVCPCGIMYMDHTSFWLHKTNAHKADNVLACGGCSKICDSVEELQVHLNETSCERRDCS